jgi:hypothetical protein
VALAGALTSALVEFGQLVAIPGRDPSIGDVLFNTLGASVGYGLAALLPTLAHLDDRTAARLSIAAALDAILMVLATGWLLQPALPEGGYYAHWTPRFGRLEWYLGRVESARINGREVRNGRIEDPDGTRRALHGGGVIEVDFTAGPPVRALAPLFSVSDAFEREVFLVGPDRHDAVLRYRTRSRNWGLDQPDLRVPGGWPATPPGAAERLRAWSPGAGEWCLANPIGSWCGLGYTPGAGWGLLFYAEGHPRWLKVVLSACWIGLVVMPAGFFLRGAGGSFAAVAALLIGFTLLPGPVALLPGGVAEWLGGGGGLVGGALIAKLLRRWRLPGDHGSGGTVDPG